MNVGYEPDSLLLDWPGRQASDALEGYRFIAVDGKLNIYLPPQTAMLLV